MYRYERSGTMHGLFRVRGFTQVPWGSGRLTTSHLLGLHVPQESPSQAAAAVAAARSGPVRSSTLWLHPCGVADCGHAALEASSQPKACYGA